MAVEYFDAQKYRLERSRLKTFQTEVSFKGKKYEFSFDAHDPAEARDKARMHLVAEVTGVPDSVKEEMYNLSDENITVVEKDDRPDKP